MTTDRWSIIAMTAFILVAFSTGTFAVPIEFTQQFPGGFNVSINNGPLAASGPIKITGVLESTTADIDSETSRGEFPLTSVTFNGAGFVNRHVSTPLSLLIFSTSNFAFQRLGEFNEGVTGWNGETSAGNFITDANNLSTLVSF